MKKIIDSIHRKLSKIELIVLFLVKIRNQCNSVIGKHLCYTPKMEYNGELLLLQSLKPNSSLPFIVFDIGSNHGEYTDKVLMTVKGNLELFLFEPNTLLFNKLVEKYSLQNIHLSSTAISDIIGESKFYLNEDSDQLSSLIKDKNSRIHSSILVKTDTLDNFVEQHNLKKIDLVKIDVEGYELQVLKGGSEILKMGLIDIIQFEYSSQWAIAGSTLAFTIDFLNQYDYQVYRLTPHGLVPVNYSQWGEYFQYSNYVAISSQSTKKSHPILRLIR